MEGLKIMNKTALVTGSNRGIGLATALTLAREGLKVFAGMRDPQSNSKDILSLVSDESLAVEIVELDVDNEASVQRCFGAIESSGEKVDVLINNASMLGPRVPIAHYPEIEWAKVFQINVIAPFLLTKGLFSLLDTSEDSCVINISSSVGRKGRAYWGAYSASKFAIEGFTQTLADETEEAKQIQIKLFKNKICFRDAKEAAEHILSLIHI